MRASIRIVISLMILQAVALQSVAQRRSRSAPKNNPTQVRELIHAANRGDLEKVLELLDKGVNVNAIYDGDNGDNVDDIQLSGKTALMIASWRGYENMVEALLKRGANVHRSRYRNSSALMLAAETDNVKTIKLLLQAGANPNIQAMSFHAGEITPLILTINRKNEHSIEIAEALIAAGAKINPTGKFLISPLMHAVDDLEMVKLLIARGANVDQRNFRGSTALMMAALDGKATVVKYLLEKGADINARDDEGNTALKYAEERRALLFPEERDEILRILKR